jgi:hypothetical protein
MAVKQTKDELGKCRARPSVRGRQTFARDRTNHYRTGCEFGKLKIVAASYDRDAGKINLLIR